MARILTEEQKLKRKEYKKKYQQDNRDSISQKKKEYYKNNKHIWENNIKKNRDRINKGRREHYKKNRDRIRKKAKIYTRTYYLRHTDRVKSASKKCRQENLARYSARESARSKVYRENNKEKITKRRANSLKRDLERSNLRYKNDIHFRLSILLRKRLYASIKNKSKKGSAVKLLGCSVEELTKFLELKFTEGMSWSNHGEWHIDHIMPLSSFDLTDIEQLKKACHYTNLQPLWARDNLIKGNKIIPIVHH